MPTATRTSSSRSTRSAVSPSRTAPAAAWRSSRSVSSIAAPARPRSRRRRSGRDSRRCFGWGSSGWCSRARCRRSPDPGAPPFRAPHPLQRLRLDLPGRRVSGIDHRARRRNLQLHQHGPRVARPHRAVSLVRPRLHQPAAHFTGRSSRSTRRSRTRPTSRTSTPASPPSSTTCDAIAGLLPKGGRMLEVGSYTGMFLKIARERGFDVLGVEPSVLGLLLRARDAGDPHSHGQCGERPRRTSRSTSSARGTSSSTSPIRWSSSSRSTGGWFPAEFTPSPRSTTGTGTRDSWASAGPG